MSGKNELLEAEAVERFMGRMHRREAWRLVLLGLFVVNALAALGLGVGVLLTRDLSAGAALPALTGSVVGLLLLGTLWRRSLRRLQDYRDRSRSMRSYLAASLAAIRGAIRERRLILLVAAGVLTPLAGLGVYGLMRQGAMSGSDVVGFAILHGVALAVVTGVCLHELQHQLLPAGNQLERWVRDLEGGE